MSHRLILAGGGHAHLYTLCRLQQLTAQGARVTLITPDRHHYYSGMAPAMLAGSCPPDEIRIDIAGLASRGGADCVIGTAGAIDAANRRLLLDDGTALSYDTLSCNVGSITPCPSHLPRTVIPVKPIVNLLAARNTVSALGTARRPPSFLVIGGGPAGVELAAALWHQMFASGVHARITLVTGHALLPGLPDSARALALRSLCDRGIDVREQVRVVSYADGMAALTAGDDVPFDLALLAAGVIPPPLFRDSGLPTAADGSLLVNAHLQSVAHPDLFGGGDCITPTDGILPRVGVHAVRQGPVLFANLLARISGAPLSPFRPQNRYLQILNMGDNTGLLVYGNHVFTGRAPLLLKQFIDRRYLRGFHR